MNLSACLIVKNEEATLGRCLSSLRPVCDEIIVVDTGSQDNTRALAAAGARVFEFRWTDDFSAARNFSLAQASRPWILVCDADEALDAADYPELQRILSAPESDGYEIIIRNYFTSPSFSVMERMAVPNTSSYRTGREYPYYVDHHLLRLFRNDARIRFSGRIHETVGGAFGTYGLRVGRSPLVVHHFGKTYIEREEKKRFLYLQMTERRWRENPDDLQSRFDYAIQLFVAQRYRECAQILQAMLRDHPMDNEMIYVYLSRALQAEGRCAEALTAARHAQRCNAENPLIYCTVGDALQGLRQYAEAETAYRQAAALSPHLPEPFVGLSNAAWNVGRREESLQYMQQATARDPNNLVLLEWAAARGVSCEQYEAACPLAHRLVTERYQGADRWVIFLCLYYHQSGRKKEAMQVLQEGLSANPTHPRLRALESHMNPSEAGAAPSPTHENLAKVHTLSESPQAIIR